MVISFAKQLFHGLLGGASEEVQDGRDDSNKRLREYKEGTEQTDRDRRAEGRKERGFKHVRPSTLA